MNKIPPLRGTHDFIGKDIIFYNEIKKIISEMATQYDFNEIITPILEYNELFTKPLGENSDVVLKEMYSFEDRNKSLITLRPEYTTPMIRAAITNSLFNKLPVKLFGLGPMFRRERPQKGRYRQFNQINFEIFGSSDSISDAELIILANNFIKKLKNENKTTLYLNSLGDLNTLKKYKHELTTYYSKYKKELSSESVLKIDTNPLRILDSKDSKDLKININAPIISNFYSSSANRIFENIKELLSKSNINFQIDKNLVRGLDYYCHTVFEFKTNSLGSQDTIIGGGRYDGLIEKLGGPKIPGVGWASGIERLMMMMNKAKDISHDVQVVVIDELFKHQAFDLIIKLRENNFKVKFDYKYNLKKSLSLANELKIKNVIIIGEDEVKNSYFTLKDLKAKKQIKVNFDELILNLNS